MINPRLEELCESIRTNLGCTEMPVDPEQIAKEEGIVLAPENYGNGFDGRIEYLPKHRRFVIYYQAAYSELSHARVRFSLAHELGHYYLEQHREELCSGKFHNSLQALSSDRIREREADSFAASLLIPRSELDIRMGTKGFMDMREIVKMALDLHVSVPAAAIRYFGYAEEKCAVVMSENGRTLCHLPSDSMIEIGFCFMRKDTQIPPRSAARELLFEEARQAIRGTKSSTDEWYDRPYNNFDIYEDSYALGYRNRIITLLSI